MNINAERFVRRLPEGAPAHLGGDIRTAFKTLDTARELIEKVHGNVKLTKIGKSLEIAKALTDGPLAHTAQLRKDAAMRRADATGQRAKLRERVTKAEGFSQALKAETRGWFRGLSAEKRTEAIKSADPLIIEALTTAPHFLSDLPQGLWESLVEAAIEAQHGDVLQQIATLEEAYDVADSAFETVERLIGNEADVSPETVSLANVPEDPVEKPLDENGVIIVEKKKRAEFDAMPPFKKMEWIRSGGAVVD
jgi:hypothetical protein